jgi:hypothetical protein
VNDYWLTQYILGAIGWGYVVLTLIAVALALWLPKRRRTKTLFTLIVLGSASILPLRGYQNYLEKREAADAYGKKLTSALALFGERCKSAGKKIVRTVEGVEGIVWMKWRDRTLNRDDQFKLDDPYGSDCGGEDCILRLLKVTKGAELNPEEAQRHTRGYKFIETVDPFDGNRYRYVGAIKPAPSWTPEAIEKANMAGKPLEPYNYRFSLERQPINRFTTRYGITWDDLSTHEDREQWVAGGSVKVVDLQTNEVIAERKGFMIDKGLGSKKGFRSPWLFAEQFACPMFPTIGTSDPRRRRSGAETRDFANEVLKPN